jgi:hypothetical protein
MTVSSPTPTKEPKSQSSGFSSRMIFVAEDGFDFGPRAVTPLPLFPAVNRKLEIKFPITRLGLIVHGQPEGLTEPAL